jgi:Arc/MetJ-type ribon-helix-helix transcriptional regulator
MKITISLPGKLAAELDELAEKNGRSSRNHIIRKLLRDSIVREKQWRIAQRYVEGKKTLRQCAELLGVDLEGMINILQDLNIPLEAEDSPQHKLTLKMLRQR